MKTERPKQLMPEEMLMDLLQLVRNQFCPDLDAREWGKLAQFIKVKVLMWPAAFIGGKGFTLSVVRYDQIMREIVQGVKQHGQTAAVRYWPGYLMMCVQKHWRIHWEEYYREAKSAVAISEAALMHLVKTPVQSGPTVEPIAAAHAVLTAKARKPRAVQKPGQLAFNIV